MPTPAMNVTVAGAVPQAGTDEGARSSSFAA